MALTLWPVLICLAAGSVAAEDNTWEPPALVPDNPVLELGGGKHWTTKGKLVVLGPDERDGRFHVGTVHFWNAILEADTAGLIGVAHPTDGVGMAYGPTFTVWFPKERGLELFRASAKNEVLENWNEPGRRVWVFNSKEVFKEKAPLILHTPTNRIFVVFKLDFEAGEESGICHAQQVVRILYTGEADEAELEECLVAHHGE